MYNKYICVGNLTRDPETRPVNDSDSVTNLAVAVNNPLNKDEVFYADVQAWGKVGENCAKYLAKGKRVLVEGRLRTNSWTSKEGETKILSDAKNGTKINIKIFGASKLFMLGTKFQIFIVILSVYNMIMK